MAAAVDHSPDEGKINGKYPIFNDILTFLWCKMKLCPRDNLLHVTKVFYKRDDIISARDVLYEKFPNQNGIRRVKHRRSEDDLICMYNVLQEIDTEDPPVFATVNLNNIPYVDLKNIDGVSLLYKQLKMEEQQQELLQQQNIMREQLVEISKFLQKSDIEGEIRTAPPSPRVLFSDVIGGRQQSSNHGQQTTLVTVAETPIPPRPTSLGTRVNDFLRDSRRASIQRADVPVCVNDVLGNITSEVSDTRISKRFVRDSDGFIRKEKKSRSLATGRKNGTRVRVAPVVKQTRVFVSRLDPDFPEEELREFVRELTGSNCQISKLKSKFPTYSSFVITCDKQHENTLLDPDEWEQGIIIRPFFGKVFSDNSSAVDNR